MKKYKLLWGAFGVTFVLIGIGMFMAAQPGQLDAFAECIAETDTTYYGAFWCPHCQNQNQLFGRSKDLLPYVECSTPDGQNQTPECIEAEIQSYPTWEFPDGTRQTGVQQLEHIAEMTGCELTQ